MQHYAVKLLYRYGEYECLTTELFTLENKQDVWEGVKASLVSELDPEDDYEDEGDYVSFYCCDYAVSLYGFKIIDEKTYDILNRYI